MGATQARYHNGGATIEQDAWLLKLGEDGCFVPDCDDTLMIITPAWEPEQETKEVWQVKVYPNPARDHVSIEVGDTKGLRLKLTDLNGRTVSEQDISGSLHTLSLTGLPNGIFALHLTDSQNNRVFTTRLAVFH
jgi:hypothetical protein